MSGKLSSLSNHSCRKELWASIWFPEVATKDLAWYKVDYILIIHGLTRYEIEYTNDWSLLPKDVALHAPMYAASGCYRLIRAIATI